MIDVALMIEGQNGLTWPRWQKLVGLAEDLGFAGLYRSDHFTNAKPPDKDSLELWTSLTWLAANTRRIEFGPLVTPLSFRHPALTARMAAAVDDLSGGRMTLGLGAGWQEREHVSFGFDLLPLPERFARFENGLEVVTCLLQSDSPTSLKGDYYSLQNAVLLPRPARPGGPPILIGGNGKERTLELAARFASEWNAIFLTPAEMRVCNEILDGKLSAQGRDPETVRRSLMTGCEFGRDTAEVTELVQARTQGRLTPEELRNRGVAVGVADQLVEQLGKWAEAGVQRVMLQWLALDDTARLEALAAQVLPQLQ
jgi:F420-dependent oxidoreductase-like protein